MRMANRCLSYTLGKTKVPIYQPIIIIRPRRSIFSGVAYRNGRKKIELD